MSVSSMYNWLQATTGMGVPTAQTHTPASATPQASPVYRVNTIPTASPPINRGRPLPTGGYVDPGTTSRSQALSEGVRAGAASQPAVRGYTPPAAGATAPVSLSQRLSGGYRPPSAITAKNAAAAAGGTLAQATAAARAATPTTVARGALQASPMIGAGLSGVLAAGATRATGGSWAEAAFAGGGAAVGSSVGLAGGLAVGAGSLGTGNPFIAAASPIAGQLGGAAIGAELGRRTPSVLGRIPGVGGALAKAAGGIIPGAGLIGAGAGLLRDFLQPEEVAGGAIASPTETTYGEPPFTGGQSPGVNYRIRYSVGGSPREGVIPSMDVYGPVSGLTRQVTPGPGPFGESYGVSYPGTVRNSAGNSVQVFLNLGGSSFQWINSVNGESAFSVTGLTVTPWNGEPDTGGDPLGPPITQPTAPRPRPYNPLDNIPPAASPTNTPPATAPAPNNNASQAPAIRPKAAPTAAPAAPAPGPSLPAGDPLQSPAPQQNPTANPDPTAAPTATPDNTPASTPSATPARDRLTKLKPGETIKLPSGTTITGTERGYEISTPTDNPNTIKLPNGDYLRPGETSTVTEEETASFPWWAVPFLAVPAGQLIKDPTKPGGFIQTPPAEPTPPKPLPPETGCRCNGPILAGQAAQTAEIADLTQRLVRIEGNQTGPQGFAGLYAFLVEMRTKLGAIGDFAEKAWKATQMQKVLDVLTFIGVMHNVSMLSRDIGETFFYLIGQGLNIVGIDDEEGNQLDIGSIVGTSVNNYVRRFFGDAFVDGAIDSYRKANRIVQSTSMVIWSIRSISDATQDLLEWVAENTGKIGNALLRFGVVGERAYKPMSERAQAQHRMRRRFDKLTGTMERADDIVSSATMATSNVLEIQQETGEAFENFGHLRESVVDFIPDPWLANEPVETQLATEAAASAAPAITAANAERPN
ncbi:hypothetical protein IQ265_12795 [Nodosilinea sp. LEGE 06152]|uniref:hypothetical protein n=1 Tax=Nodosilinea sp. LEGE 06152 TaxID=2777966 RepID=UPI00187E799B|nr:hypothetical protein [Nodosilinea sp. LEGE 06152]MBE9157697.1 hypothetical protein [Nodosilinea sp. LEGE 06152]